MPPNLNPTVVAALVGLAGAVVAKLVEPPLARLTARWQRRAAQRDERSAAQVTAEVDRAKLASGDYQWIITDLRAEIADLRAQMRDFEADRVQWRKVEHQLRGENERLKAELAQVHAQNEERATELATLRARVATLEASHAVIPTPLPPVAQT